MSDQDQAIIDLEEKIDRLDKKIDRLIDLLNRWTIKEKLKRDGVGFF